MEKTISITPTINSSNKNHTKKKDDLQKKAEIAAIMEKYNLKTPRKSKLQDNKTDYVIKPKAESQIIHITKEQPQVKPLVNQNIENITPKPILISKPNIASNNLNIISSKQNITYNPLITSKPITVLETKKIETKKIETKKIETNIESSIKTPQTTNKDTNTNISIHQTNIPSINKVSENVRNMSNINTNMNLREEIKPKPSKPITINTIINNDKYVAEKQKLEMPKAIINKNNIHPKDYMSSRNIYNNK